MNKIINKKTLAFAMAFVAVGSVGMSSSMMLNASAGNLSGSTSSVGGTTSIQSNPSAPNIVLSKHAIKVEQNTEEPNWSSYIKNIFDDEDNLTKRDVVIEEDVDMKTLGLYNVHYKVTDSDRQSNEDNLQVEVVKEGTEGIDTSFSTGTEGIDSNGSTSTDSDTTNENSSNDEVAKKQPKDWTPETI